MKRPGEVKIGSYYYPLAAIATVALVGIVAAAALVFFVF